MQEPESTTPCGRRSARRLCLAPDGDLYDLDEQCRVSVRELGEEVKAGRQFRVRRQGSGAECTHEVLLQVVRSSLSLYMPWSAAGGLLSAAGRILQGTTDAFESARPCRESAIAAVKIAGPFAREGQR
jgi:hypothetical protein